jgi:hypothetical protein
LLRTGTHPEVWENLSAEGIARAKAEGWRGSDQAWLSYCLADKCKVWPRDCGIYQKQDKVYGGPPANAKIIHFNGEPKYWQMDMPWIREAVA